MALMCIYVKFLPVPKAMHMSAAGCLVSNVWNLPMMISVSTVHTKQVVEPVSLSFMSATAGTIA